MLMTEAEKEKFITLFEDATDYYVECVCESKVKIYQFPPMNDYDFWLLRECVEKMDTEE
jgi:hypothetical protein